MCVSVCLLNFIRHLVYPFEAGNNTIVNKDRRGELFYYMHQQVCEINFNFDGSIQ